MLYMFLRIAYDENLKKLKPLPQNKVLIIKAFIRSLYFREQREKSDNFDVDTFHILLCYLGFQSRDRTGSNVGLDQNVLLEILKEIKDALNLSMNLIDFLAKAVDLHILVRDGDQYSFSHELYQEYFASEALRISRNYDKD